MSSFLNSISSSSTSNGSSSSSSNNFKLHRICDNTISGLDCRQREIKLISELVQFESDESIEMLWLHSDKFEEYFTIEKNTMVGLTNYRIFKLENGNLDFNFYSDVKAAKHVKNGLFKWDKVSLELFNGKEETYGIYHSNACEYFTNRINANLKNKNYKTVQIEAEFINPPKYPELR